MHYPTGTDDFFFFEERTDEFDHPKVSRLISMFNTSH